MSALIEKQMMNFIHNALNHNSMYKYLLYTKLRCRHSCFADNFRYSSYKYEWENDVSFLMGKVQMKLNTLYSRSTLSHTVSELCEMRDENIVNI